MVGNKLSHAVVIFIVLVTIVIVASSIAELSQVSLTYTAPTDESVSVAAKSLLTVEGGNHIFNTAVSHFTGFAPSGTFLASMLGVGIAE